MEINYKKTAFPRKVFISGIDTDAGKSYVTGIIARRLIEAGISTTTLKFVQTGNVGYSEDIEIHRRIMGTEKSKYDENLLTSPEIFTYPCSPDLASRIDGRPIDFEKIHNAIDTLVKNYDVVMIEGAGGLMVPLQGEYLTIDYIKDQKLPVILTVNSRLGSINHALLSLYAIKKYGIDLYAVAYNSYYDNDKIIAEDTRNYIKEWLNNHFPETYFIEIETI